MSRGATQLGIVTGLAAEAALLNRAGAGVAPPPIILATGANLNRAREGVARMVRAGADCLLSFGVAGGLDPALDPGHLIVADGVHTPQGARIAADPERRDGLRAALCGGAPGGLSVADIAGADAPLTSAADKHRLYAATGAAAVDMESHVVAEAAREHGLPFAAVRAVGDPAARALPRAALYGLSADGRPRPFAVAGRLMLRPWEIFALLRVARDTAAALEALGGVADPVLAALGAV